MSEPCGWTITGCGCGSCWDSYTPEQRETASALAIGFMWAATGRRYGLCDVVVQPCVRPAVMRDYVTYPVDRDDYGIAYIRNGNWYNGCGGESSISSCCSGCEIVLDGPTTTSGITEVTVGGVVVPPESYVVMNGNILVRTDGECWPTCTNYSSQSPPGFQIEYKRGEAIPDRVQKATERLACEWAKACAGDSSCALPKRLKSLTRQGIEVSVEEASTDDPKRIRTGIPEVDIIVASENPYGRPMRSLVWSPDETHPRVLS